jgi:hypothetical protein
MFKKIKDKMEYSFLKLLLARVKSRSPKFYVELRYISGALVFLAAFLAGIVKSHFFPIPGNVEVEILSLCTKVGPLMTGVWGASFTGTTDTALINKSNNQ